MRIISVSVRILTALTVEDMYKIFDRLLARGYTEEQAEKISHRNFERIFENA